MAAIFGVNVLRPYAFDGSREEQVHQAIDSAALWFLQFVLDLGADYTGIDIRPCQRCDGGAFVHDTQCVATIRLRGQRGFHSFLPASYG